MSGNSINFNDKKIKKSNFYKNKEIFDINDIDINKIFVYKKEKYGKYNSFKHFIKTYKNNITTIFFNKKGSKKVPEEKIPHKRLSIIILDSVLYAYEKYHPQIFLECKYVKENKKIKNYIDKELKSESDSNSNGDSDSDTNNEE